jgi:hypothetical protein
MFAAFFRMAILSFFIGLLLASGARTDDKKIALNVGDKAPASEARTDADATWDSAERFGKTWSISIPRFTQEDGNAPNVNQ